MGLKGLISVTLKGLKMTLIRSRNRIIGNALVLMALCSGVVYADWEVYEETSVKGSISGTIKKGSIIQMMSGSIYEVSGRTRQRVRERSPEALILRNGSLYRLVIDGFDEPLICKQLTAPNTRVETVSQVPNSLSTPNTLQDPNVSLFYIMPLINQQAMGLHKLTKTEQHELTLSLTSLYMAGYENGLETCKESAPIEVSAKKATVIESRVDGEFSGWDGSTIVKLANGQIWEQSEYHYHYHYAYSPSVLIYMTGGTYKMKIDGVDKAVRVVRLR